MDGAVARWKRLSSRTPWVWRGHPSQGGIAVDRALKAAILLSAQSACVLRGFSTCGPSPVQLLTPCLKDPLQATGRRFCSLTCGSVLGTFCACVWERGSPVAAKGHYPHSPASGIPLPLAGKTSGNPTRGLPWTPSGGTLPVCWERESPGGGSF